MANVEEKVEAVKAEANRLDARLGSLLSQVQDLVAENKAKDKKIEELVAKDKKNKTRIKLKEETILKQQATIDELRNVIKVMTAGYRRSRRESEEGKRTKVIEVMMVDESEEDKSKEDTSESEEDTSESKDKVEKEPPGWLDLCPEAAIMSRMDSTLDGVEVPQKIRTKRGEVVDPAGMTLRVFDLPLGPQVRPVEKKKEKTWKSLEDRYHLR